VVAKGNGLCCLQVGEARHDGIRIGLSEIEDRMLQMRAKLYQMVDCTAQVQANIRSNLVIAVRQSTSVSTASKSGSLSS